MALHIGIVGCSAEGAALCYRTICTEAPQLLGAHAHPEVTLHTHSLGDYVQCIENNDWRGVAELMLSSARKLAAAGADFLICPDNTIHQALPFVLPQSPLPWLPIPAVVAEEAAQRGFTRIALLGTRWLVESNVYPADYVRATEEERAEIHRVIMDELVNGIFRAESIAYFQKTIARLADEGCDAVVLGCTEIPLIINDGNSALPVLDSTRRLARAAIRRAAA
ncbi:MAG TPA: amino acid racemase [Thermoanaerobaculia bacterium]|nr:amino acid racemase [Thermoanaerobaculia bacterium]